MESARTEERVSQKTHNWIERLKKAMSASDKDDKLKMVAIFILGLTVLHPYHAAVAGSRFAVKRFQVPTELLSIYVSKFHTAHHTVNIMGIITVNLYLWFYGSRNLRFNPLLSVFSTMVVFILNVCLAVAYMVKRSKGSLTLYYWMTIMCSFSCGVNQSLAASVGVEYLAFFTCGLQFAGIGVTFFHTLFLTVAKMFPNMDVDYWIVVLQISISSMFSFGSFVLWNLAFGEGDVFRLISGKEILGNKLDQVAKMEALGTPQASRRESHQGPTPRSPRATVRRARRTVDLELYGADLSIHSLRSSEYVSPTRRKRSEGSFGTSFGSGSQESQDEPVPLPHTATPPPPPNIFFGIKMARSPILMSALSMAVAFFFYPAVAPYKLASLENAHRIDLSVLVTASIPPFVICVLCILGHGPNKKWTEKDFFWNYFWYLALPYVMCPLFFLIAMHYPQNGFSKFVRFPFVLGFLTTGMIACYSILKSIGYSGAGMQEDQRNGTVSTFNMLFSFLFLFTGVFWGSGYIKVYNKYDETSWPTENMSWIRSFLYWAHNSFEAGFSNFTSIVTNDLMRDITSVPEV